MEQIVFKSDMLQGGKNFQIASGYISTTNILFENEGIMAAIEAQGHIDFYDLADNLLASLDVQNQDGGREVYQDVHCNVEDNFIIIKFPIYEWIDNYPHCDGEYDRWDTRIIGYHRVCFDTKTNTANVTGE